MSLYRKMDVQQAAGPGTSGEGAEAANQLMDNLLNTGNFNETTADHVQAAQSFQEALTGQAAPQPPELPNLEVTSNAGTAAPMDTGSLAGSDFAGQLSGQMNGLLQTTMDIAFKLADPMGFLNAICQFLIALFTNVATQFGQILPQIDLYNQAAQAALDTKKLLGSQQRITPPTPKG